MKLLSGEILNFDSSEYRKKIRQYDYSYHQLATNIYCKRRAIASSKTSVVGTVLCAGVTGGMSIFGTALAGRNISIEKQKLELLEKEWARRGAPPLPKRHIKDMVIPVVLSSAISMFTFTVDLGIANTAANAALAAQMGIAGAEFHGHLVGAYYTGIEKGLSSVSNRANRAVSDSRSR